MIQVYDRRQKRVVDEKECAVASIRFLYNTRTGRILLKSFVYRKPVSGLYSIYEKSPLSKGKIKKFVKKYNIVTSDCYDRKYRNFNEFFTRQRIRYVDQTRENELPAIADSKLTVYQINSSSRFSIKNSVYTVAELLENETAAEKYTGGLCLVFRLTPDDYHRYVYPDSGTQEPTVKIKGVLHSVNPISADNNVYSRNSRQWTVLHTEHFGEMIQIEVGALLVGKIRNHYLQGGAYFSKLDEKGYFEYGGSTVALLIPPGVVQMDDDILEYSAKGIETKVIIGERIGSRMESPDAARLSDS